MAPSAPEFLFHARFAKVLSSHGVTARKVGQALGFTEATVSNWRSGKIIPSADKIVLLARFLGVSADYLLGLSDDENPAPASVSASGNAVAAGRDATVSADAAESARLRARNAELEAQIARMTDAVTQLSTRLAALSAALPLK